MKTIIAGGRDFNNPNYMRQCLSEVKLEGWRITEVVSGGAKGADAMGESLAKKYSIPLTIFPADWDQYGKAAGAIRNSEMADYADALIAFWDKKSKGTLNMIETAAKRGLYVKVFFY